MECSKAFRARIQLSDEHALRLQTFAAKNFALSCVFRSGRSTILIGLTDRARCAASFARTLRSALKRMAIPTDARALNGHWVTLVSAHQAVVLCAGTGDLPVSHPAGASAQPTGEAGNSSQSDVKLVTLPR